MKLVLEIDQIPLETNFWRGPTFVFCFEYMHLLKVSFFITLFAITIFCLAMLFVGILQLLQRIYKMKVDSS